MSKRYRYKPLIDWDLLSLMDRVAIVLDMNEAHKIESRLFKIVQRTDTKDFVAIIEEVRQ